jgi:pimeloyl-ACP methyl ester carboxylesterase
MSLEEARHGDLKIAYEVLGAPGGEPLLLVMGNGAQMLLWHDDFCMALVDQGFTVVRFDPRDIGLSTHLTQHVASPPYRLEDIAGDVIAVLNALGWDSTHLAGFSMGGLIAQFVALSDRARVRSLTSISSTSTPSLRVIRPRLLVAAKVFVRTLKPSSGREAAGAAMVNLFRAVGSPAYPLDEDWLREVGRRSYDRDPGRLGMRRQEQAIRASRDLRHELASLRVPTLVLHGEADPAISVNAGRATMRAIPGARLVTYPGMGHDLPGALWPAIVAEIWALAVRATSAHGSQT